VANDQFSIRVSLAPDEDYKPILEGLRAYNTQYLGEINHIRLVLQAKDSSGALMGGVVGGVHLNWLNVNILWVEETHRHKGLGTALLAEMEKQGKLRGATRVMLETLGFQAPDFYRRLGYVEFGRIKEFSSGFDKFYLEKKLG
jgi:GNAT superfamily N-acetyltransferase